MLWMAYVAGCVTYQESSIRYEVFAVNMKNFLNMIADEYCPFDDQVHDV